MKIDITKNEYRLLLDILYLGEWMLNSHDLGEDPAKSRYVDVVQKFYSYADEMGCGDLIDAFKDENRYYPNRKYEEKSGVLELTQDYDEQSFWQELVSRLSDRDALHSLNSNDMKDLTPAEYIELTYPFEEKYYTEFETNGLDNLVLRSPNED
jgi:hypothetical protein